MQCPCCQLPQHLAVLRTSDRSLAETSSRVYRSFCIVPPCTPRRTRILAFLTNSVPLATFPPIPSFLPSLRHVIHRQSLDALKNQVLAPVRKSNQLPEYSLRAATIFQILIKIFGASLSLKFALAFRISVRRGISTDYRQFPGHSGGPPCIRSSASHDNPSSG